MVLQPEDVNLLYTVIIKPCCTVLIKTILCGWYKFIFRGFIVCQYHRAEILKTKTHFFKVTQDGVVGI